MNPKHKKYCDNCKILPKHKNKAEIRCSMCMSWYHEECVGIKKNDPIGIWVCLTCRAVPEHIKLEITSLKNDVSQLKTTTNMILSSVQKLSTQIENCVGGINDRITALTRQINLHDITMSEAIENVSTKASNIKSTVDQKTNQIVNKTTAVFEKIKLHENNLKKSAGTQVYEQNDGAQVKQTKNSKQTQQSAIPKVTEASKKRADADKGKTTKFCEQRKKPKKQLQTQNLNKSADINELIDLTKPTRNTIKQSTLLIGSSILKNIKTSELNRNTAVRTISGATIDMMKDKLSNLNTEQCKTIILHVWGNDADQGEDIESFRENFEELIDTVADGIKRIIVSGLLPRESVDLEPYNETLKSLCADNAVEFVDNYDSFLLATGDQADSYYTSDKTHINTAGTRKLLRNINEVHQIISTLPMEDHRKNRPGFKRNHYNGFKPNHFNNRNSRRLINFCHICHIGGGHNTEECWFNGRADRPTGHMSW